ncbi:MAG: hypothetical protein KDE50_31090, partial [Caldilineaceae bacterium]|nr:hypothetical protein [Caldilineaceae bacterium]
VRRTLSSRTVLVNPCATHLASTRGKKDVGKAWLFKMAPRLGMSFGYPHKWIAAARLALDVTEFIRC